MCVNTTSQRAPCLFENYKTPVFTVAGRHFTFIVSTFAQWKFEHKTNQEGLNSIVFFFCLLSWKNKIVFKLHDIFVYVIKRTVHGHLEIEQDMEFISISHDWGQWTLEKSIAVEDKFHISARPYIICILSIWFRQR